MPSEINPEFLWASGVAVVIAIAATLRMRIRAPDEFKLMSWMDWCGHFALTGIAMTLAFGLIGFDILRNAGMVLVFSLYPLAILGLLGRFDEMISEIIRAIRRR